MTILEEYRASDMEVARTADLMRVVPRSRKSVLDIGARDGHFSKLLTSCFESVTALDLELPTFDIPGVTPVAGDVTRLQFDDSSFDCIFCTEVLEHIPDLRKACREIIRVAKHDIVIGVPFEQDTRVGRCTCPACRKTNPPWGHVNTFTEARLLDLFQGTRHVSTSFVGTTTSRTTALAAFLMDRGLNPWGAYNQSEPCIFCGGRLQEPVGRRFWHKVCSSVAIRMDLLQERFAQPKPNWIHIVFSKD